MGFKANQVNSSSSSSSRSSTSTAAALPTPSTTTFSTAWASATSGTPSPSSSSSSSSSAPLPPSHAAAASRSFPPQSRAEMVVPSIPPPTGPHPVGSLDIEIASSSLATVDDKTPPTLLFRLFYPSTSPGVAGRQKVHWLPIPHQASYLSGYLRFIGLSKWGSTVLSYTPLRHLLTYITIPAFEYAPPKPGKMPVVIFSHGLGGTRHAYSALATSMASQGALVACVEHRDGSAPTTFVREYITGSHGDVRKEVEYVALKHELNQGTADGRNAQLEKRLRELGMLYSALEKLNLGTLAGVKGIHVGSQLEMTKPEALKLLGDFKDQLPDLNEPGKVIFAGHSFGSATTVQFLKSIFYPPIEEALYIPPSESESSLKLQISPTTPTVLLDLWCLPLLGARTRPLYKKPLPGYQQPPSATKPAILHLHSQQFFDWSAGSRAIWKTLSKTPDQAPIPFPSELRAVEWRLIEGSKHMGPSDFTMLTPSWLVKDAKTLCLEYISSVTGFLKGLGYENFEGEITGKELKGGEWGDGGSEWEEKELERSEKQIEKTENEGGVRSNL